MFTASWLWWPNDRVDNRFRLRLGISQAYCWLLELIAIVPNDEPFGSPRGNSKDAVMAISRRWARQDADGRKSLAAKCTNFATARQVFPERR